MEPLGLSLPFSALDESHVETLRLARQEARLKKNNEAFLEYLQKYGVSPANLHEIRWEDAQVLREAINTGLLSEKVFALSWKTFHANEELQRAAGATGESVNADDHTNASKKKKKRNRNKKKKKPAAVPDPGIIENTGLSEESNDEDPEETDPTPSETHRSHAEEIVQIVQNLAPGQLVTLFEVDKPNKPQEDKDKRPETTGIEKEATHRSGGSSVMETNPSEYGDQVHADNQKPQGQKKGGRRGRGGRKKRGAKGSHKKQVSSSSQAGEDELTEDDKQSQASLLPQVDEPLELGQQFGESNASKGGDNDSQLGKLDLEDPKLEGPEAEENKTTSTSLGPVTENGGDSKQKKTKRSKKAREAQQAAALAQTARATQVLPSFKLTDPTSPGEHASLDNKHQLESKGKTIDDPSNIAPTASLGSAKETYSPSFQEPFEPKTWAQVVAGNIFAQRTPYVDTNTNFPHDKQQLDSATSQARSGSGKHAEGSHSDFPASPTFPRATGSTSNPTSSFTFRSQIPSRDVEGETGTSTRPLEFPSLPGRREDTSSLTTSSSQRNKVLQRPSSSDASSSQQAPVIPTKASDLPSKKRKSGDQRQPAPASRHRRNSKSLGKLDEAASEVPEFSQAKAQLASLPLPQSLEEARKERQAQREEAKKTRERSIEVIRKATAARVSGEGSSILLHIANMFIVSKFISISLARISIPARRNPDIKKGCKHLGNAFHRKLSGFTTKSERLYALTLFFVC